mmetsp:Transcript_97913/g.280058  ORF Transcript_97913/g.280058 Transcript_97913/m.280058 type:complete len:202 (+) Transcript_97913:167-772(+)
MEALPSDRAEYQGKLLNATARQKNVENDAQLLQNRIALLKKEEARAWRKIQQTKGRAEEIVRMRKENERKNQEKVVMAKRAEEKERKLAEENLRMEERARRARAMQLDEMYRKKQQEVAVVKMEKVNNKEYVQKQNMMSLKEKKAKREAIKRHEEVRPHDHATGPRHWATPLGHATGPCHWAMPLDHATGPCHQHPQRSMS